MFTLVWRSRSALPIKCYGHLFVRPNSKSFETDPFLKITLAYFFSLPDLTGKGAPGIEPAPDDLGERDLDLRGREGRPRDGVRPVETSVRPARDRSVQGATDQRRRQDHYPHIKVHQT